MGDCVCVYETEGDCVCVYETEGDCVCVYETEALGLRDAGALEQYLLELQYMHGPAICGAAHR